MKWVLLLALAFVPRAEADGTINDSLVSDLACSSLKKKDVLKNLQRDAFSLDRQFPVRNWAANMLGQCWALALSQREFYYLGRYSVPNARRKQDETVLYALNLIKGTQPDPNAAPRNYGESGNEASTYEAPTPLQVFEIEDKGLLEVDRYGYATTSKFMNALQSGVNGRSFRSEIEARQMGRFYSPGNLGMIFGGRERSEDTNEDTMKEILASWERGRIPLIIIRASTAAQHAVLIKHIEKVRDGHYVFTVYDSNQPGREPQMEYKDRQFYAPRIVGLFHADGYSPVGVFLKDEDEMDELQEAVFNHYSAVCEKTAPSAKSSFEKLGAFEQGVKFMERGDLKRARSTFEKMLQKNAKSQFARFQLAVTFHLAGENLNAQKQLDQVTDKKLKKMVPLVRGESFLQAEKWAEAEKVWEKFPENNPDLKALKAQGLARSFESAGKNKEAAESWARYLELQVKPTNDVFQKIAENRVKAGEVEAGLEYCGRTRMLAKHESYQLLCKAHVYRAADDGDKAIETVKKALDIDKENFDALEMLRAWN